MDIQTLEHFLQTKESEGVKKEVSITLQTIARASLELSKIISVNGLSDLLNCNGLKTQNIDGDTQKALDVYADELFLKSFTDSPVGIYASEELELPTIINLNENILVTMDPLDGSSNINTNITIGSIFSIYELNHSGSEDILRNVLREGREQIASGFVIYGPQTTMVIAVNGGSYYFVYNGEQYVTHGNKIKIPKNTKEFSINMSNYFEWHLPIRSYIDDLLEGEEGIRQKRYNMRWIASLVADTYRILMRGGVFLYPEDNRRGYERGRLRLLYECHPIALIIENAGGRSIYGGGDMLDLTPTGVHDRAPLLFGSADEIDFMQTYYDESYRKNARAPLFNKRNLFRN